MYSVKLLMMDSGTVRKCGFFLFQK